MSDWQATDAAVAIAATPRFSVHGRVTRVIGQIVEATSLEVAVGEVCRIHVSEDAGVMAHNCTTRINYLAFAWQTLARVFSF